MERLASKLGKTKHQTSKEQRLSRIPRKFIAVGNLLPLAFLAIAAHAQTAQFVGSTTCKRCHAQIFDRWSKTRMANIVVDPAQHPEAIIPDLTKPDSLVKFNRSDIAFVYGGKWKQRYFTKVGDDYFPLGAQWDVTNKIWRAYFVQPGTDWWVRFYPADNMKRPTGPTCDGCHSVNYNIQTKAVTEWNVGCEKCHGPGSEHANRPSRSNIINPARLDFIHASDVCIQCHSQGRPLKNPIEGRYYDWPVGFIVGQNLSDYWQLEDHTLGQLTFTHFPDGTAHKNRMQGNDFVQSVMYNHRVTCSSCHDAHGTDNNSLLRKPASEMCLQCHGPASPNGPRGATIGQHTHHEPGSAGNECINCHMPRIEQTIANINVRSHTFRFIAPAEAERLKMPNSCNTCHADKEAAWATSALKQWQNESPWRVAN